MQMLTKNCRKSESSLSLSCENAVTAGTNFRPFKATRRDERSHLCLREFCLISVRIVL